MQWGSNIICNGVTHLRIRMQLYSSQTKCSGSTTQCGGTGRGRPFAEYAKEVPRLEPHFTDWELDAYAEVDWDFTNTWIPFAPYPGDIPVRWQQCLDIEA